MAVVDLLEAVEVDEHTRDLPAVAPRAFDRLVERRREADAVGEAGQRVAVGERRDALARRRDLAHVAPDAAIAEERAVGVVARLAAYREMARDAIADRPRDLEVAERHAGLDHLLVHGPGGLVRADRGHFPRRLAERAVAYRGRRVAWPVHDARQAMLYVRLPEEVARELCEAAEARLAVAQRILGAAALQELAEQATDGGRGVDEALVGLARRVAGEGEERDGAAVRHHRDREGG